MVETNFINSSNLEDECNSLARQLNESNERGGKMLALLKRFHNLGMDDAFDDPEYEELWADVDDFLWTKIGL